MLNQELINYISKEKKKGKEYFEISKFLFKSEYSIKEIQEAFRIIQIVGLDNLTGNEIENIKKDKLFLKKASGLNFYFNLIFIIISVIILMSLINLFIFDFKSNNILEFYIIILGIIYSIITAIGIYLAKSWGFGLFAISLCISAYTIIWNQLFNLFIGTFVYSYYNNVEAIILGLLILPNIIIVVLGFFCLFKIFKKMFKLQIKT
ncbi:MAG: hypothetical protein ACOC3X_03785 [Nanoarchaeota archaeon]